MQESVALLGYHTLYQASLGVIVEGDGIGMVFRLALLEEGPSRDIAGGIGNTMGVDGLACEVHLDSVGLEQHIVVVDLALGIEEGATACEVHCHRITGLVLYNIGQCPIRQTHKGVHIVQWRLDCCGRSPDTVGRPYPVMADRRIANHAH